VRRRGEYEMAGVAVLSRVHRARARVAKRSFAVISACAAQPAVVLRPTPVSGVSSTGTLITSVSDRGLRSSLRTNQALSPRQTLRGRLRCATPARRPVRPPSRSASPWRTSLAIYSRALGNSVRLSQVLRPQIGGPRRSSADVLRLPSAPEPSECRSY